MTEKINRPHGGPASAGFGRRRFMQSAAAAAGGAVILAAGAEPELTGRHAPDDGNGLPEIARRYGGEFGEIGKDV